MANIIKSTPFTWSQLPKNPLANYSNCFTPLQYQNTFIGPRDFIQPSQIDNLYIEKQDDLPVMVVENS